MNVVASTPLLLAQNKPSTSSRNIAKNVLILILLIVHLSKYDQYDVKYY